jgi:hypothetical protein
VAALLNFSLGLLRIDLTVSFEKKRSHGAKLGKLQSGVVIAAHQVERRRG